MKIYKAKTKRLSTVLITGGAGFLGQACARSFLAAGWRVIGIGHSRWTIEESCAAGFGRWVNASVSTKSLVGLQEKIDCVVHCAGSGSVGFSYQHPLGSFENTVGTTAKLLEYLRSHNPKALILYPSSAAVYGANDDKPLAETEAPNPVSPYGFYKLMVESLLAAYTKAFGQPTIAVRFFSIYGAGLRKQLLWDASRRILSGASPLTFWGTGDETRDWIHADDAARLMLFLAERPPAAELDSKLKVINGASGIRVTVREVLKQLASALGSTIDIKFNGKTRTGDPQFYHADVGKLEEIGWKTMVDLQHGLTNYASWVHEQLTTQGFVQQTYKPTVIKKKKQVYIS